ncbi:ARM repeat-containing protein [Pisolithus albus]|nr:ARM repeat-containing protein [Pisolithus albus]
MEGVERHVRSWFASEKPAEINHVISALSSGECTLLDIVKALGEYLTSEEDILRTKGVQFLSLVIEGCPKEKLNRQAVHVLVTFYRTKLDDTETITPALEGLSHLVRSPALGSSDIPDLLNAMFTHVKMRVLVQSIRFFVFDTINTLLKTHLDDLKAMGDQFVAGYAALASGEKDPRNLTVAFAIARVILTEFDISKHVEDYFDITFCYFPITFRPPPNDPYGISADDLKSSLLPCLSATPAFGRLGVPSFWKNSQLGHLSLRSRDTLRAMSLCLPVYGSSVARDLGSNIWSALKLEIFQPVDAATEEAALDTLQAFVRVLQSNPVVADQGRADDMDDFVRTVCVDCLDTFGEPEKPQARAGMKILCSFLSIARMPFQYSSNHTFFHDPMEVSNRASVIVLLTNLLNSLAPPENLPTPDKPVVTASGSIPSSQDLLTSSKDAVLGVLTVGLKTPSTRVPSLHGLAALIRVPSVVTKDELGYIVSEVGEFVGKEANDAEDTTSNVLSLLSSIAVVAPQHVATQVLPPLFLALPDRPPPRDAHSQRAAYWRALSALSQLCTQPELFETFVIRLTTKLDLLCSPLPRMEPAAAYAHAILTALGNTLSAKVSKSRPDADVPKYINTLLPRLFRLCLEAAIAKEQRLFADMRLLRAVARIIKLIVEASPTASQNKFFDDLVSAYLDGQVKSIVGGDLSFSSEEFSPMNAGISTRQRNTVVLYAAAHVPMRRDVSLDTTKLSSRLADLVTWCSSDNCTASQREAVSHILASLVNKRADDIGDFLKYQIDDYWSKVINNHTVSASDRRNAVTLWVSIARALLVRSHPSAMAFTDKLFILIDEGDEVGREAAHALGPLAIKDEVLVLYAQRYLNVVLPRILEAVQNVTGSRREAAYLVALASVLSAVPKTLYLPQMTKLMPLLIRGLNLDDPKLRVDIINILTSTVDAASDEKSSLPSYASTLVLEMLKNSMVTDMPDPRVRIAALKYLALLPGVIRYDVLHPYKAQVLKELGKVLDDPRRAVRKEAVDARYKYTG